MVLLILIFSLVIGAALFFFGPDILNSILVVTDEWREIFREIRERRS